MVKFESCILNPKKGFLNVFVMFEKATVERVVPWASTTGEFHSRFDRYVDLEFFKHPIHWFLAFNSFMMALFLMGSVAVACLWIALFAALLPGQDNAIAPGHITTPLLFA